MSNSNYFFSRNIGNIARQERREKKKRKKENISWNCKRISEGGNKAIKYSGYCVFLFLGLSLLSITTWLAQLMEDNFFSLFGVISLFVGLFILALVLLIISSVVNKKCYQPEEFIGDEKKED